MAEGSPASIEAALTLLTVKDSTKSVLLQTTQSAVSLVAAASGTLTYNPNGTVLDGKDFSDFLTAGHKNSAVTGMLFCLVLHTMHLHQSAHCSGAARHAWGTRIWPKLKLSCRLLELKTAASLQEVQKMVLDQASAYWRTMSSLQK